MTVPMPYYANAQVVYVHDGDTIYCEIDRGMYDYGGSWDHPLPVRLTGCNARELAMVGGPEAAAHLTALLPPHTPVVLWTVKPDKYAPRWDAVVETAATPSLQAFLIAEQWAIYWNGSGPAPVPVWPRTVA